MAYGSQDLSTFIPEVWSKKFLKILDEKFVMKPLVNRDFEGDIKSFGDTVHVRLVGNVTVNTYTRQQTLVLDELTASEETMAIDQQKYFYFGIDDLDKAQMDVNLMEKYMDRAAVAVRDVVDTRLLAHYANTNSSNDIGSTSVPITLTPENVYDHFVDMAKNLMNQNVPDDSQFNAVITPDVRAMILKSPELRDRSTAMVDETIRNGKVGTFAGWNLHVTTNIATVSNTKPLMFFTPDFITYASQLEKIEHVRPHDLFADAVKGLYLYGSKAFTQHNKFGGTLYAAV